jgi:hypothetical protein
MPQSEEVILLHRRGLTAVDQNLAFIRPQEAER